MIVWANEMILIVIFITDLNHQITLELTCDSCEGPKQLHLREHSVHAQIATEREDDCVSVGLSRVLQYNSLS